MITRKGAQKTEIQFPCKNRMGKNEHKTPMTSQLRKLGEVLRGDLGTPGPPGLKAELKLTVLYPVWRKNVTTGNSPGGLPGVPRGGGEGQWVRCCQLMEQEQAWPHQGASGVQTATLRMLNKVHTLACFLLSSEPPTAQSISSRVRCTSTLHTTKKKRLCQLHCSTMLSYHFGF